MMSKIKKIMGVVLTLTLIFSMFTVAPASAEDAELTISTVTSNTKSYNSSSSSTASVSANTEVNLLSDGLASTWLQWDRSAYNAGVTLTVNLEKMSKVSKIEIYVGHADTATYLGNYSYTTVPVTAFARKPADDSWSVKGNWALNGDGTITSKTPAVTLSTSTTSLDALDKPIEIDVDNYICDSFTIGVSSTSKVRMGVAEIKVYGENVEEQTLPGDVLCDAQGNAICTIETNKKVSDANVEENMLDDDSDAADATAITRWGAGAPAVGGKNTEIIFRLDGVYNISGLKVCEYWQRAAQTTTGFKDVDLYVGNTTGAYTNWGEQPIAEGLRFSTGSKGGSVENIIYGSEDMVYKGDSFKIVINGADAVESYDAWTLISDVELYGEKTDDALSGTTMRCCEMSSNDGTTNYDYIASSATTVTLTPTFSGTQPSTVAIAAYDADGKLVGAAFGAAGSAITMDNISGTISYIKIFGWSSRDTLVPVSTTFARYAVTQ